MDKKSIAMLLVACSFASSAFATSFMNKLITKHSSTSSVVKTHKMTKQANQSYTDFSGTWTVNCGDLPSFSTVIENDANYIKLDGIEYMIGHGLSGQSESNEYHTRSENISLEWNADGSALTIKSINFSKSNMDNSVIESDLFKTTLTMKNDELNLDGTGTMFEDVTQVAQPLPVHCVFSKKQ